MTGIVIGGLLGYGIALAAFVTFRWSDKMFVSRADLIEHSHEPAIRKAA